MNIKYDKKFWKNAALIGSPIAACGLVIGIFFAVKGCSAHNSIQDNSKNVSHTALTNVGNIDVFPKLATYDFYDQIRIKDGKQIITDEFIAAVVNKVIKEMVVTDGDILWNYTLDEDRQNLSVTFHWDKQGENRFWKTYNFSLSASV